MPTYRTPDVYVEEISVFPPSVAEVETAIPAFIGYTERAMRTTADDLRMLPTRITSLLEFEGLFGGAPQLLVDRVDLDAAGRFQSVRLAAGNTHYLYDALRLFFDNGGGKAWIVSVGGHDEAVDKTALVGGLARIAAVDEPTLLLSPDAAALSDADRAEVQVAALNQCGKLGDRIALLDTALASSKAEHQAAVSALRNGIGINHLKYGAAYAPWLKLAYPKPVRHADIAGKLWRANVQTTLAGLTGDGAIVALLQGMGQIEADLGGLGARHALVSGGAGTAVGEALGADLLAFQGADAAAKAGALQAVFARVFKIATMADAMATGGGAFTHAGLKDRAAAAIAQVLKPRLSTLVALEKELDAALPDADYVLQYTAVGALLSADWTTLFTGGGSPAASDGAVTAAADDAGAIAAAATLLQAELGALLAALDGIDAAATAFRDTTERALLDSFSAYRDIVRGVSGALTACPPSGAIAGICALVDGQRGVWKAPANVSLTGVVGPSYAFDSDDTDDLNVDPVSGKSVNAIRAFVGKGTLVWGARTLAGNDNEWRYVSVRRFFNMVEESIRKSTYWAVFEPNDANTWVKVRGMVENYLTQKWREGALAGATTKDAFFVRCGLGQTMSAQDVLEGRLNVEIGMAAVRPAEFIILKFSHKLQTS